MLTPRMVPGIVRKKRAGFTNDGLAAEYGVSPALLRQAVAQRARMERIHKLTRERNAVIRELVRLGETHHAIAHAFGMDLETVRKIKPRGRLKAK